MAGLRAALSSIPEWGRERAVTMAERFRTALAEAGCDVVVPEERATLVSWRVPADESADVVTRLAEAGRHRPRPAGQGARPSVRRLVDEQRRPRPPCRGARPVSDPQSIRRREAVEITETPYGSVGLLHTGRELNVWWIHKEREEIDPEWTIFSATTCSTSSREA